MANGPSPVRQPNHQALHHTIPIRPARGPLVRGTALAPRKYFALQCMHTNREYHTNVLTTYAPPAHHQSFTHCKHIAHAGTRKTRKGKSQTCQRRHYGETAPPHGSLAGRCGIDHEQGHSPTDGWRRGLTRDLSDPMRQSQTEQHRTLRRSGAHTEKLRRCSSAQRAPQRPL